MRALRAYDVEFVGLKLGVHQYAFEADQTFFELFGEQDFRKPVAKYAMQLDKRNNLMEVSISMEGSAEVDCDISGEPYTEQLEAELQLVVKFGEEFNNEDPEILVLPHGEYQFNVAQYLYEMFVLSVPQKRVHPQLGEGVGEEALDLLDQYAPGHVEEDPASEDETDPRWNKLKDLL